MIFLQWAKSYHSGRVSFLAPGNEVHWLHMKKFINRPQDVVEEMLQGLLVLHPGSARLPGHKVIIRAEADHARERQVAVLSGEAAVMSPRMLKALGHTLRHELGGSSGPLYGVLFLRCGSVLESNHASDLDQWIEALDQGCQAISEMGGAKPGDRTMLDALDPFVKTLRQANAAPAPCHAAVEAAERGVEASAQMQPKLGRSSYLGNRVIGHPDPGAKAVAIWLRALCEALFTKR